MSLFKGMKQRQNLLYNLFQVLKDKELANKIAKSAGSSREIKMATFIAIQHGEDALRNYYE